MVNNTVNKKKTGIPAGKNDKTMITVAGVAETTKGLEASNYNKKTFEIGEGYVVIKAYPNRNEQNREGKE